MAASVLDRLRQPQYTGENRCTPCTVVNAAIAVVVALGIGAAAIPVGTTVAALLAVVAASVFAATIYLRGYLVPGTPRLTKTYVPDWLLRRFETHEPGERTGGPALDTDVTGTDPTTNAPAQNETGVTTADATADATADVTDDDAKTVENVEAFLLRAGAVTECADEDDLCLTDEFRTAWRAQIERLRSDDTTRADLATVLDVDADRLSVEEYEDAFIARLDERRVGRWESHAAFLADVAAANVLRQRHDPWTALDVPSRSSVLSGLRIFLERCPSCDGPVTVDERVVESCCRSLDVLAVTCQDCNARVFEIEGV
ncbi:MAG: hypothetical protein ABEI96_11000 [Haloarculaceae archaeon]